LKPLVRKHNDNHCDKMKIWSIPFTKLAKKFSSLMANF